MSICIKDQIQNMNIVLAAQWGVHIAMPATT